MLGMIIRSLSLVSQSGAAYSCSHLARFARARFALRVHEHFKKKVSQSTRNALKCIEMQKRITPYECFFPLPQNA